MSTLEECKASLQKGSDGKVIYNHVVEVLKYISIERPDNVFEIFEGLSRHIKDNINENNNNNITNDINNDIQNNVKKWVENTIALTNNPKEEADAVVGDMPDWQLEAYMFYDVGIGFNKIENYEIHCSLRRLLATTEGIQSVRLWGKILGSSMDYIVAEGKIEAREDPERENSDPRGTGSNRFVYWVTNTPSSPWVMLPDVSAEEIVHARRLKRILTGVLTTPVTTHPFFPGTEKQLLRSLLAIITSETHVCPRGYFQQPQDTEDPIAIEKVGQWVTPASSQLKHLYNWTHCREYILYNGRTTYQEVDAEENEELFKKLETAKRECPILSPLRPLTSDTPILPGIEGAEGAWSIVQVVDECPYDQKNKPTTNTVTAVTSIKWPGAVTVFKGRTLASIYVGYGHQHGSPSFFPPATAEIQREPDEGEEQPEPQPLEEEEQPTGGDEGEEPAEEDN
eukprot:GHVR01114810.1.p1 GENE.GHVR01114810.1~~GHVR01114810.1.p1  ORF type:complete len:454 (+),score=112.29 GHVR01114810.1:17-1378(+)